MTKLILVALLALVATTAALEKMKFRDFIRPGRDPVPSKATTAIRPKNISEQWVTQRVDNFDTQNSATWQQRYFENSEFYRPGGPLYVYLGGEWRVSEGQVTDSLMIEMCREMYGYAFYLEHRFYGESFPTEDVSDANLRFLTHDQALADIAHFIDFLQDNIEGAEDAQVVVIGAHYAGNLATWFRQKYPHLAVAAWASSAPVLSVFNHQEYKVNAAETYRDIGGNECWDAIAEGFEDLEEMLEADQFEEISEWFNLCDELDDTPLDISTFFALIAEFYSLIPQFGTVQDVDMVCNLIRSDDYATPAEALAFILITVLSEEECLPIDYEFVIDLDREIELDSLSVTSGFRQASYQWCTQLGWHHTSDSDNQPFGERFGLDFYIQACEDVFGDVFSNATAHLNVDRSNIVHGGLNPEVTNVLFTQGEMDPWRTIGIQESLNDDAPAFIIDGASQANDINEITETDSAALVAMKLQIKYLLRYWITRDQGIIVVPN